jgi:hypothetical protein
MPPSDKKDDLLDLKIELAIVKKDIEQLQKDVDDIKTEIYEIKSWAMKAFWIVAGAVILQVTTFLLNGGLHAISK